MYIPYEIANSPDEDIIIGDIEAFMDYVDNGQAENDWHAIVAARLRKLGDIF